MDISVQTAVPSFFSQSAQSTTAADKAAVPANSDRSKSASDKSNETKSADAKKEQQVKQAQESADQVTLQGLRARDQEVRAHEAAHVAAAGSYVTSGPSYTYERGPDGSSYAVGGEVQLDASAEADPEASLTKAQTIKRAALAPAQPSSQDFSVAASATQTASQARLEIASERRDEVAQRQEETQGVKEALAENNEASAESTTDSAESSEVTRLNPARVAGDNRTDSGNQTSTQQSNANGNPNSDFSNSQTAKITDLYNQQNRQFNSIISIYA